MGMIPRSISAGLLAVVTLSLVGCASAAGSAGSSGSAASTSSAGAITTAITIAPPTCPPKYDATNSIWVPTQAQGVDGLSRLAPSSTPTAALVCAYLHTTADGGLTGSKQLTGDLAPLAGALSAAPAAATAAPVACPQYFRAVDADDYLIALRYPAGLLWISAPRFHCAGSGNGVFTSSANFGDRADAWYQAGVASATASPSAAPTS